MLWRLTRNLRSRLGIVVMVPLLLCVPLSAQTGEGTISLDGDGVRFASDKWLAAFSSLEDTQKLLGRYSSREEYPGGDFIDYEDDLKGISLHFNREGKFEAISVYFYLRKRGSDKLYPTEQKGLRIEDLDIHPGLRIDNKVESSHDLFEILNEAGYKYQVENSSNLIRVRKIMMKSGSLLYFTFLDDLNYGMRGLQYHFE